MIPQRKLTRTGFSNGISYRVEACRRRLRTVRTSEAQSQFEECRAEAEFETAGLNGEATAVTFSMIEAQEREEAGIT